MKILLVNAGSSSLKTTLVESSDGRELASGLTDWAGPEIHYSYTGSDGVRHAETLSMKGHASAMQRFLQDLVQRSPVVLPDVAALSGVGHRIVHGGAFTSSVRITAEVRSRIKALSELAPLHNPPSLEALAATEVGLPDVPQVAVFDTAFHATLPAHSWTYAVPEKWTRDWGVRRFGFHGLSYAYCSRRAAEMLERPLKELRLVICHLGHGCSAAAVEYGKSVETTMGYTPLEGLMMATRSGSIDPSIVLQVQKQQHLTIEQVETALNRESGLLGVSGVSGDMRQVLSAASKGDERARLALSIYIHRLRQAIGALAVTMGGVDGLVFTAGVGEHSAEIRQAVCQGLDCLGLELDEQLNASCTGDADLSGKRSRGRVLVMTTREDVTLLREVINVLRENLPGDEHGERVVS